MFELSYCLHCGAVEMTDNGCRVCGGSCGRVATAAERSRWQAMKQKLNLVWNGIEYAVKDQQLTKPGSSWGPGEVDRMSGAYDDGEIARYHERSW